MARLGWIGLILAVLGLLVLVALPEPDPSPEHDDLGWDETPPERSEAVQLQGHAARDADAQTKSVRATLPPSPTGPYVFFAMSAENEAALAGVEIATQDGERLGATGPTGTLRIEDGDATELNILATLAGHGIARDPPQGRHTGCGGLP